jgi:pimeloyl-ACP methyl ester carboxylesterase
MGWVEVRATDIHYVEAGGGPTLVFLHGFGSCAEAWSQQFDAFSDRFRVVAYDSVNHGHSSASPRSQPEPDRADELEGFLAAMGIEDPILAGNSMGALTILRWATRHPRGARALIPSGMGIRTEQDDDAMPATTRRAMFAPVGEEVVFLPADGGFTKDFPTSRPSDYERYVRLRSTATRIEAARHPRTFTMRDPTREELAERVKTIGSPMQVVVGEHDWLRTAARRLAELVPGARLAEVPGAPHNVYYEAAEAYNAVVVQFLEAVLGH